MTIGSLFSTAAAGIQSGMALANQAGARIARGGGDDAEQLAKALIAQREGEFQVKFAANVVKTADEMLGSLIDIRA